MFPNCGGNFSSGLRLRILKRANAPEFQGISDLPVGIFSELRICKPVWSRVNSSTNTSLGQHPVPFGTNRIPNSIT
jgi:hypothetical protein